MYSLYVLGEQWRIVAYLDGFPLSRDLRQARLASHKGMISLREFALPAPAGHPPKYDNENLECTFDDQIVGFGQGWGGADPVRRRCDRTPEGRGRLSPYRVLRKERYDVFVSSSTRVDCLTIHM